MKKEYLNEEKYQNINNKIKAKGKLITNITLVIGIALILTGTIIMIFSKTASNNNNNEDLINSQIAAKEKEYEAEKTNLKNKLSQITTDLSAKKQALIDKGIKESSNYNDGEAYDLYVLDNALDPGFKTHYCAFDTYSKNEMTADYCLLVNVMDGDTFNYSCDDENEIIEKYCALSSELSKLKYDKTYQDIIPQNNRHRSTYIPFIMLGFFIAFASLIFKFSLFSITHRREIAAYTAQQIMPLAQEGIEKMAPTIGGAAGTIGKEIAKGIKEGLNEEDGSKDAE